MTLFRKPLNKDRNRGGQKRPLRKGKTMKKTLITIFAFNALIFSGANAQKIVGGCSYPEVTLEGREGANTFFRLRPGKSALFQMNFDYTLRSYEKIFNFQACKGQTGSNKKCVLWTNMLKDRVVHTLDTCGDTWTLVSEKYNHFNPVSIFRGKKFSYKFEGCWLNL